MMNKALSQRIKELMSYKRIKSVDMAKMLGVTTTTLNNWRSGNTAISHENIKKIVDLFDDIDYAWLADGQGQMVKSPVNREYCLDCVKKDAQIDLLKQQVSELQKEVNLLNKKIWRCGCDE